MLHPDSIQITSTYKSGYQEVKEYICVFRQMEFQLFLVFSLCVFLCGQFLLWLTTQSLRAVDSSKVVALPPQGGNV